MGFVEAAIVVLALVWALRDQDRRGKKRGD